MAAPPGQAGASPARGTGSGALPNVDYRHMQLGACTLWLLARAVYMRAERPPMPLSLRRHGPQARRRDNSSGLRQAELPAQPLRPRHTRGPLQSSRHIYSQDRDSADPFRRSRLLQPFANYLPSPSTDQAKPQKGLKHQLVRCLAVREREARTQVSAEIRQESKKARTSLERSAKSLVTFRQGPAPVNEGIAAASLTPSTAGQP